MTDVKVIFGHPFANAKSPTMERIRRKREAERKREQEERKARERKERREARLLSDAEACRRWMKRELEDGPKLATYMKEEAERRGWSPGTLRNAKQALEVVSIKESGKGPHAPWKWHKPEEWPQ